MRFSISLLEYLVTRGFLLICVLTLFGCSTPPSVTPLLRVTERALLDEVQRLQADARRGDEAMRASLASLEDGYNRDLEQAEALTPTWIREATTVYVAAREAVIEHRAEVAHEHDTRADNLMAAAESVRRAADLIDRRDRLLDGVFVEDLQRLMAPAGRGIREAIR